MSDYSSFWIHFYSFICLLLTNVSLFLFSPVFRLFVEILLFFSFIALEVNHYFSLIVVIVLIFLTCIPNVIVFILFFSLFLWVSGETYWVDRNHLVQDTLWGGSLSFYLSICYNLINVYKFNIPHKLGAENHLQLPVDLLKLNPLRRIHIVNPKLIIPLLFAFSSFIYALNCSSK